MSAKTVADVLMGMRLEVESNFQADSVSPVAHLALKQLVFGGFSISVYYSGARISVLHEPETPIEDSGTQDLPPYLASLYEVP